MEKKGVNLCLGCGCKLNKSHGNALRCGNEREKKGCAYKAYRERNRKWKIAHKYHLIRNREKMREYSRKYYKIKRIRKS